MAERVLTLRELNRALLARQLLLRRARTVRGPCDRVPGRPSGAMVAGALRRPLVSTGGLPDPAARARSRSEESRKATLMRSTLHLASSADYPIFAAAIVDARPATAFMLCGLSTCLRRGRTAFTVAPTSSRTRRGSVQLPRAARADEVSRPPLPRCLRPGHVDDMASWIGVPTPAIRAVLEEAPRTFRDEAGRLLHDVARAPLHPQTRRRRRACFPSGTPRCSPMRPQSAREFSPTAIASG